MSLVQKMWQRAGVAFRAKVGKELSGHGLLYEDVLVETEEVPAALPCLQLGLALVQPRPPPSYSSFTPQPCSRCRALRSPFPSCNITPPKLTAAGQAGAVASAEGRHERARDPAEACDGAVVAAEAATPGGRRDAGPLEAVLGPLP